MKRTRLIAILLAIILSASTVVFASELPQDENVNTQEIILESEQPDTVVEPSLIKDLTVEATDVDKCKITWKANGLFVNIRLTCGDIDKTLVTDSGSYEATGIPFDKTATFILTTDDMHEPIEISCNPSDEFTPVSIKNNETQELNKNRSNPSYYCSDWVVYAKNGTAIASSNYSINCSDITQPGFFEVNIAFKNKFKNYKPLKTTLKVIPGKPSLAYNTQCPNLDNIVFSAKNYANNCDTVIAELSTNKDFTDPARKIKDIKGDPVTFKFEGLKQNSTYYIRVRLKKTIDDKAVYSEWSAVTLYTAKKLPGYSTTQEDVKKIISLTKKNKSFTYTFNGRYSAADLYDFMNGLDRDFAQYSERYYRDSDFDGGIVKVKYTLRDSSKVSQCESTTKVINSIVKNAKKKKGAKAKVTYVNTRLCKLCKYDYDTYKKNKKKSVLAYSAYGCLVRHKAVCQGYAEAFHLIMVQLGIPDKYQHTTNHIWNRVKIGKTWYHVDVTWNDTCGKRTKYLLKKSHK